MKITESQLRRIIREEIALNEAPPPPPPPKGEASNKIALPLKAKDLISNAMAELIALGKKYEQAAKDPDSEASKKLHQTATGNGMDSPRSPLSIIIRNLYRGIVDNTTINAMDPEKRKSILNAVRTSMSIDPETGKWTGSEKDKPADNYVSDHSPSLEEIARICLAIPVRMRQAFNKNNIQQP